MITFLDGPAAGVELSLRRAPVVLRVVSARKGHWDALDQLDDVAAAHETIYVYRLVEQPTHLHILARGTGGEALRGFWASATYAFLRDQPGDVHTRDSAAWVAWWMANKDRLTPDWLKERQVSPVNLIDQLTDRALVTSLRSTLCPCCGGTKKRSQTFCGRDYFRLPEAARRALYAGLGEGYRESVHEAMGMLGADTFRLPPEGKAEVSAC